MFILQPNLSVQFRNTGVVGKDTRVTEDTGVWLWLADSWGQVMHHLWPYCLFSLIGWSDPVQHCVKQRKICQKSNSKASSHTKDLLDIDLLAIAQFLLCNITFFSFSFKISMNNESIFLITVVIFINSFTFLFHFTFKGLFGFPVTI